MAEIEGDIGSCSCVLVIFGATGDLAQRKLFPALYNLFREGQLPENFAVVGLGRSLEDTEQLRDLVCRSVETYSRRLEKGVCERFRALVHYLRFDIRRDADYRRLGRLLETLDRERDTGGNRIFYLAVSPALFVPVVENLDEQGLVPGRSGWHLRRGGERWYRLMIEKPFGEDLASARELNRRLRGVFEEEQIYRIDHYLGKEMIQNLMVIRFANTMFEPIWNGRYIDNVQISVLEEEGVGVRSGYYDQSGALRDMVQSHMLQLLALMAMEPPVELDTGAIRDEKVKVIRSLAPSQDPRRASCVVRGQYTAGDPGGGRVPGYREEDGVGNESKTETFVAVRLFMNNFRWSGVPFYLRTGKRLPRKSAEIIIEFKTLPGVLYFERERGLEPNLLVIKIQPEEGIYVQFNTRESGSRQAIVPVRMNFFNSETFPENSPESYERLLYDALLGSAALFTRWDEVESAWMFVDRLASCTGCEQPAPYPAGTWGPPEADEIIRRDGRTWWDRP